MVLYLLCLQGICVSGKQQMGGMGSSEMWLHCSPTKERSHIILPAQQYVVYINKKFAFLQSVSQ